MCVCEKMGKIKGGLEYHMKSIGMFIIVFIHKFSTRGEPAEILSHHPLLGEMILD